MPKKQPPIDIDWKGDQVLSNAEDAARKGIDEIMALCVSDSKQTVPVATAALQGGIKVSQPARKDGDEIAGIWGSHDVFYALAIETGDRSYLRGMSRNSTAGMGKVQTKRNKGRRNSLRDAADTHYPELAGAIRSHMV